MKHRTLHSMFSLALRATMALLLSGASALGPFPLRADEPSADAANAQGDAKPANKSKVACED